MHTNETFRLLRTIFAVNSTEAKTTGIVFAQMRLSPAVIDYPTQPRVPTAVFLKSQTILQPNSSLILIAAREKFGFVISARHWHRGDRSALVFGKSTVVQLPPFIALAGLNPTAYDVAGHIKSAAIYCERILSA